MITLTDTDRDAIKVLVVAALKEKFPELSDATIDDIYTTYGQIVEKYFQDKYPAY